MCKRWIYLLAILSVLGTSTLVCAEVFIDDFNTPHDYLVDGVTGTIWDGFVGDTVDALNASGPT